MAALATSPNAERPPALPPRPARVDDRLLEDTEIYDDATHGRQTLPATSLHRSTGIVYLALGYAALAITAWTITFIASRRPIGGHSYTFDRQWSEDHNEGSIKPAAEDAFTFTSGEEYVKAARVLQAIVSVLAIPLTSAVCSQAAVVYLQRAGQNEPGPTLRQTMVLADKSWTEPLIVLKLLFSRDWTRRGSLFFYVAAFLTVLGAATAPLQAILVSYKTIQTPAVSDSITAADMIEAVDTLKTNDEYLIALTRNKLASTKREDPQFRLWSKNDGCEERKCSGVDEKIRNSLYELAYLHDPYWAQPPSSFHTGAVKQFAPRLNSTSTYDIIAPDSMPQGCRANTDSFFVNYVSEGYNATICMPNNRRPWRSQRMRQDFTEELYLQATFLGPYAKLIDDGRPVNAAKITMKTTAGYFELPNYMNNRKAGPLIPGDPGSECNATASCYWQWQFVDLEASRRDKNAQNLAETQRGPLATLARALFGNGSIFDDKLDGVDPVTVIDSHAGSCAQMLPLVGILDSMSDNSPCLNATIWSGDRVGARAAYLSHFFNNNAADGIVSIAFEAAAFITIDVMMSLAHHSNLIIQKLSGPGVLVPTMSYASAIVISSLLGIFLTSLVAMSLFSAWTPRWTTRLDSFAMIRIGAARPECFPLRVTYKVDRIQTLDNIPGWVGDGTSSHDTEVLKHEPLSELGLGAQMPLSKRAKYHCYEDDDEEFYESILRQQK
ncbi:hypothetical protein QQS21_002582 [Conoideocrella luteorostrata]|uniref:Uncharacterized protein n=1 Tax=Conoideocrella luteorostrata TaxID=1105319 RepID=A0AAJ0G175_9HYPO|nr:hypothetical protein QQS21_002582 [Conoideocrella luteorostrata]